MPDESQKIGFERLIDSCIKLVLFQPKVKNTIKNYLNKLNTCCK